MLLNYIFPFEGTAHSIRRIEAAHGESFQLTAKVTNEGKKIDLTQYTLTALYQTAAEVGTSVLFRSLGVAATTDGYAVVTWLNENEVFETDNYKIWLQATKDGKISYPAIWDVYLEQSPGPEPAIIDPTDPTELASNIVFTHSLGVEFDEHAEYQPGDPVAYRGWLWVCETAHSGAWDSDDFQKTTIASTFLPIAGGTLTGMLNAPGVTIQISEQDATLTYDAANGWHFAVNGNGESHLLRLPSKTATLATLADLPRPYPIVGVTADNGVLTIGAQTNSQYTSDGTALSVVPGSLDLSGFAAYSETATYLKSDAVSYAGIGYVCIADKPIADNSTPDSDPVHFAPLMRDMWLAVDCTENVPETLSWDSSVDVVEGDATPVAGKINSYHITEYSFGHFKVSKDSNAVYGITATAPITATPSSGVVAITHNTTAVTAGSYGDVSSRTPYFGETFKALSASVNDTGHVTAMSEHTVTIPAYGVATSSSSGLMASNDRVKLDGIASGAQVNVLESLTVNGESSAVSVTGKTADITTPQADWNQTSSGKPDYIKNKPVVATSSADGLMGSADRIKLDGIEAGAEVNTINTVKLNGNALTVSGAAVNVEIPQADWNQASSEALDYIKNKPGLANSSSNGFMSKEDFAKLAGIAPGAQGGTITEVKTEAPLSGSATSGGVTITHDTTTVTAGSYGDTSSQTPSFGGTFKALSATVNSTGHITAMGEHTVTIPSYGVATQEASGLMAATDKAKLDGIASGAEVNTINSITVNGESSQVESSGTNVNITIPQANWGQTSSTAMDFIKNKPGVATSSADGLMGSADRVKLDGIESGAEVNTINTVKLNGNALAVSGTAVNVEIPQADWNQSSSEALDFIKNKPGLAGSSTNGFMSKEDFVKLAGVASGAQVNVLEGITVNSSSTAVSVTNKTADISIPQADWGQTSSAAMDFIKNKPVVATSSADGLMGSADRVKLDGIASGAEVNTINSISVNGSQVGSSGTNVNIVIPQADWNQSSDTALDYIKNKPGLATSSANGLMASADKAKLDGIASYAQVNVIETLEMNSSSLAVSNKKVEIPVDSSLDANSKNPLQNKVIAAIVPSAVTSSNTLADKKWVDDEIDAMAAYYITADSSGHAFATYADLSSATVFYSNGVVRIPTRNDYCVVLSDETHSSAEYRYIYAGSQWDPQYPIETNDYLALSNKPSINSVEVTGNLSAADLGLVATSQVQSTISSASAGEVLDALAAKTEFDAKLYSVAAAVAFQTETEYAVGKLVTYKGLLYRSKYAVSSSNTAVPSDDTYDSLTNPTGKWESVTVKSLLDEKTGNLGTITEVKTEAPLSGSANAGSVTITHQSTAVVAGSYGDASSQTPSFGGSFKALSATVNSTGHITAMGEHTITLPSYGLATASANGLMASSDWTKLSGVASGAQVNVIESITVNSDSSVVSVTGKTANIITPQADWNQASSDKPDFIKNKPGLATSSTNGFMAANDKAKLDGIASGATANIGTITEVKTNSPLSGSATSGSVTITHNTTDVVAGSYGDTVSQTPSFGGTFKALSATVNSTGHITAMGEHTVTIPAYGVANGSTNGLMASTDWTKLSGVASNAQVNVLEGITVNGSGTQVSVTNKTADITIPQADWNQTSSDKPDYIKNKPGVATSSANGLMGSADRIKLNGIESNAQVNTIESLSVNGTAQTITNKTVNISAASFVAVNSSWSGSANSSGRIDLALPIASAVYINSWSGTVDSYGDISLYVPFVEGAITTSYGSATTENNIINLDGIINSFSSSLSSYIGTTLEHYASAITIGTGTAYASSEGTIDISDILAPFASAASTPYGSVAVSNSILDLRNTFSSLSSAISDSLTAISSTVNASFASYASSIVVNSFYTATATNGIFDLDLPFSSYATTAAVNASFSSYAYAITTEAGTASAVNGVIDLNLPFNSYASRIVVNSSYSAIVNYGTLDLSLPLGGGGASSIVVNSSWSGTVDSNSVISLTLPLPATVKVNNSWSGTADSSGNVNLTLPFNSYASMIVVNSSYSATVTNGMLDLALPLGGGGGGGASDVYDGSLTLQLNGSSFAQFTANSIANVTANIQTTYPFVYPSASGTSNAPSYELTDHAINEITLGSVVSSAEIMFPSTISGRARDFFLRLVIEGDSAPTVGFIEQSSSSVAFDVDDDAWAEIEPGVNLMLFTDTAQ